MKREVQKRDEIILNERNETIKRVKELHSEIEHAKTTGSSQLKALEVNYERKLAQESSYLQKMQQVLIIYNITLYKDVLPQHTIELN